MANVNSDLALKSLTRHEDYYITSADLVLLVENIQFRVHRYFFERESKWFRSKLLIPASPGSQPQGSSDSNAIILDDLTPEEFARFLWVFYNPRYSLYEAEVKDWSVILRLSERWTFPEVKNLAVRELEKKEMLDVKRIKLYHENDVDRNYLIPRYSALIERENPLTLAEGIDLGMETAMQIAAGREQARSRLPGGARTPLSPTIHGADLHEVVRELFQIVPPTPGQAPVDTPVVPNSGALKTPPTQRPPSPPTPMGNPPAKPQQAKTTQTKTKTTKKEKKVPPTAPPQATVTPTAEEAQTPKTTKAQTPLSATKAQREQEAAAEEEKTRKKDQAIDQQKADETVAVTGTETDDTGNGSGIVDPAAVPPAVNLDTAPPTEGDSATKLLPDPDPFPVVNPEASSPPSDKTTSPFGDPANWQDSDLLKL